MSAWLRWRDTDRSGNYSSISKSSPPPSLRPGKHSTHGAVLKLHLPRQVGILQDAGEGSISGRLLSSSINRDRRGARIRP